ncbi:MAG: hypothetical protein AAB662_03320 [Patescibacteria group bacterium]
MIEDLGGEALTHRIRVHRRENKSGDGTQWTYYGSPIEDYEDVFKVLLPYASIKSFVSQKPSPVVLDLMAPADTLRSLFKDLKQENKLGVAVSLSDLRSVRRKKADTNLGIHQIAGDITRSSTWDTIGVELKGKKADLVMERAGLGLLYVPNTLRFYAIMISKMWNFVTSDNGMILVEVRYNKILEQWVEHLSMKGISASYAFCGWHPVIRINKSPNSPIKLPFLR